jgi:hypothetical protein
LNAVQRLTPFTPHMAHEPYEGPDAKAKFAPRLIRPVFARQGIGFVDGSRTAAAPSLRIAAVVAVVAMTKSRFSFSSEVWEHDGQGSWHFICLPEEEADEIEATFGHHAKGFGSVRVEVTIGATRWMTSLFPDSKRGTYVLPVKKAVRVAENLGAGAVAHVEIRIVPSGP